MIPLQRVWVQSLVGKLHAPYFGQKKKKKKAAMKKPELCKVPNHEALCQYKKQKTTPSGFQNQSPNVEMTRMTISFCIFWSQM